MKTLSILVVFGCLMGCGQGQTGPNGSQGNPGIPGGSGPQGSTGLQGQPGSSGTQVTLVVLCANTQNIGYALCINGSIYTSNTGNLRLLPIGAYSGASFGLTCNFNVGPSCAVF